MKIPQALGAITATSPVSKVAVMQAAGMRLGAEPADDASEAADDTPIRHKILPEHGTGMGGLSFHAHVV